MDIIHDVVVIGSGPLGAICARRLAERGLNVVMLEAGKPISTPPGSHLRNQVIYQKNPERFFDELQQWCYFYNKNGSLNELPGANVTTAFGGQGLLWYNNCPRPSAFELWPALDTATWNKRFQEAENYLQVHDNLFDQSVRQQKITKKISNYLQEQMPQRSINKLPIAAKQVDGSQVWFTATREIISDKPEITARIKIEYESKVIALNIAKNRVNTITVQTAQNKIKDIKSKYIIIAAGALGSTQILLDANIKSEALGKYLHYHPLCSAQIILAKNLCGSENTIDLPARLYIPPTPSHPWLAALVRNMFVSDTTEQVHENRLLELEFFAPMSVRQENQMLISNSTPRFDVRLTENDKAIIEKMRTDLYQIAEQLGHFRQGCEPAMKIPGFAHPMGMCRMGTDPITSVANHKGQVHGLPNLFLATVGLIPVSIAVNPTLTAAALALETADYISQKG